MIKRIALGDGATLVIQKRATGMVRIGFEHEHHTVTRADVTPETAAKVEQALVAMREVLPCGCAESPTTCHSCGVYL